MSGFVEELIDESFGASSKRWASTMSPAGIGARGAWCDGGRHRTRPGEVGPASAEPRASRTEDVPTLVGGAATQVASPWRWVSTPPPVMRDASGAHLVGSRSSGTSG